MKQSRTTLLTIVFVLLATFMAIITAVFSFLLSAVPRRQFFSSGEVQISASLKSAPELDEEITLTDYSEDLTSDSAHSISILMIWQTLSPRSLVYNFHGHSPPIA